MRRRYTQWPSLLLARHYYDKHASPSSSTCAFLLFKKKKKFDFHFWNRKKKSFAEKPHRTIFFSKLVCILADCWFACSLEEKKNNCRRVIMIISVGGPKVETPPFSLCTFRSVFSSVYIRLSELSARKWWDGQTVTLVERERRGLVGFLSFFFPIDISVGPKQNCQFSSCLNCAPPLPRPHHLVPVRCCCCRLARLFFRLLAQRYRDAQTTQT